MGVGLDAWVTRRLPEIYLAVALLVSSLLCVLTPPFDTPDEVMHARREVELAHGEWMAIPTPAGAGGTIDSNFEIVAMAMGRLRADFNARYAGLARLPDGRLTAGDLAPWQGIRWSGRGVVGWFPNTAVYPPGLYVTQTIGWRMGEAADFTILHSLYLARLLTMLCAVGIGWLTLRLCRHGRWMVAGYLLVPTVLSLGASCSQDALLLPVMALVMVLLLRAMEDGRGLKTAELVVVGTLMALCIGARIPYLPLVLLMGLPALESHERGWRKLVGPVMGMAVVVAVVGAWQLAVHPLGVFYGPDANPAMQTVFLRLHPWLGCRVVLEALAVQFPVLTAKGLYMLGSNDAGPAHAVYAVMSVGLAGLFVAHPMAGVKRRAAKVVLLFSLLSVVAGLSLAEYVVWTAPGAAVVVGLQARYFLALVPLAMLLGWDWIPKLNGPGRKRWLEWVGAGAGALFLIPVLYIPFVAAHVFYLTGPLAALRFLLR